MLRSRSPWLVLVLTAGACASDPLPLPTAEDARLAVEATVAREDWIACDELTVTEPYGREPNRFFTASGPCRYGRDGERGTLATWFDVKYVQHPERGWMLVATRRIRAEDVERLREERLTAPALERARDLHGGASRFFRGMTVPVLASLLTVVLVALVLRLVRRLRRPAMPEQDPPPAGGPFELRLPEPDPRAALPAGYETVLRRRRLSTAEQVVFAVCVMVIVPIVYTVGPVGLLLFDVFVMPVILIAYVVHAWLAGAPSSSSVRSRRMARERPKTAQSRHHWTINTDEFHDWKD